MKKHDFFDLNEIHVVFNADVKALKDSIITALKRKHKRIEQQHRIHVLINERECLWVSYFDVDFVHTNKEMDQLLMESRKLDAQILKLSN